MQLQIIKVKNKIFNCLFYKSLGQSIFLFSLRGEAKCVKNATETKKFSRLKEMSNFNVL